MSTELLSQELLSEGYDTVVLLSEDGIDHSESKSGSDTSYDDEIIQSNIRVAPRKLRAINPWIFVCVLGGCFGGLWSPLSTYAREGAIRNPYQAQFFLQTGELVSLPFILFYYGRYMITWEKKCGPITVSDYYRKFTNLPSRDQRFGMLTGSIVGE